MVKKAHKFSLIADVLAVELASEVKVLSPVQRDQISFYSVIFQNNGIALEAVFRVVEMRSGKIQLEYGYAVQWPAVEQLHNSCWTEDVSVRALKRKLSLPRPPAIATCMVTTRPDLFVHPTPFEFIPDAMERNCCIAKEIAYDVKEVATQHLLTLCDPLQLSISLFEGRPEIHLSALPTKIAAAVAYVRQKEALAKLASKTLGDLDLRSNIDEDVKRMHRAYFECLSAWIEAVH